MLNALPTVCQVGKQDSTHKFCFVNATRLFAVLLGYCTHVRLPGHALRILITRSPLWWPRGFGVPVWANAPVSPRNCDLKGRQTHMSQAVKRSDVNLVLDGIPIVMARSAPDLNSGACLCPTECHIIRALFWANRLSRT